MNIICKIFGHKMKWNRNKFPGKYKYFSKCKHCHMILDYANDSEGLKTYTVKVGKE